MEEINALIETNKDLEELATDSTNLLNDKNIIADSLPLSTYDENVTISDSILNGQQIVLSNPDKENTIILSTNEEISPPAAEDDLVKSNKENILSSDTPFQTQINKPCQFAVSRIKTIMKLDPDLSLVSKESVFLIAKATVNKIEDNFNARI